MHKTIFLKILRKISYSLLGLSLLVPVAASAQSADVQAQLAGLLAQLSQLQAQLGQVQSTSASTPVPVTNYFPNGSNVSNVSCPNPALMRGLGRGSTGSDVAALQSFLISSGYLASGNVTSYFGALTEAALQRFQAAKGIISSGTADTTGFGVAGPRTRVAITQSCGSASSSGVNPQYQNPVQNPAVITSFTATPSRVAPGQQSILNWNVRNAGGCVLSQQIPGQVSAPINVNLPASGSVVVVPAASIVYTIVCTSIGVQNFGAVQSVNVTVDGSGASMNSSSALSIVLNPSTITVGQASTLTWNSNGASSCTISTVPNIFSSTAVSGSQSTTFNTVGTTTYTFSCSGSNSQTFATSTILVVKPIPAALTASPSVGGIPLSVTFTANTGGVSYPGGVRIDYGDGTTAMLCAAGATCNNPTIVHSYAAVGTYVAALTGLSSINTTLGTATVTADNGGASICNADGSVSSLSARNSAIAKESIIIYKKMYGTLPSAAKFNSLVSGIAATSYDTAAATYPTHALAVGAEDVGAALAQVGENGATDFATKYSVTAMSNAAMIDIGWMEVFGSTPNPTDTHYLGFGQDLTYFQTLYQTKYPLSGTDVQRLLARGATYGEMVGVALEGTVTPAENYSSVVTNYLASHCADHTITARIPSPAGAGALACGSVGSGSFVGCYYDNMDFTNPLVARTDTAINFDWGNGSPDPAIGADTFSVKWEGDFIFASTATYRFTANVDDGVRLYVDGVMKMDHWVGQGPTTYTIDAPLTAGTHRIKVEYYENAGGAVAAISWAAVATTCPSGNGLTGNYYNNTDFTNLALTRTDATINFDWMNGSPDATMGADTFSVRWTGFVCAPTDGVYTFYATSDDGQRLWVGGTQLIDNWVDQVPTTKSGTISLTANTPVAIRMDYYENAIGATTKLMWSGPSIAQQIIPAAQLSH